MSTVIEIIAMVLGSMFSALALYGAIRKDLATAIATAASADASATRAHARIDSMLVQHNGSH